MPLEVQRQDARGRLRTCQETSPFSAASRILCGEPATTVVDNGDEHPYWMCDRHADHNIVNRRAIELVPAHERRRS